LLFAFQTFIYIYPNIIFVYTWLIVISFPEVEQVGKIGNFLPDKIRQCRKNREFFTRQNQTMSEKSCKI